ncbi:MAG TPA: NmrA family NAD(P)-binding protein [Acidobacteriaceae bacterium]|nr:NmrA family NAD(P)-binding protein [Acidobacteriaceae bacterium]
MKVLAVGATGQYAGLVVPELHQRGVTVRALLRDRRREAEVRQRGADEIAIGDLSDPHSLRKAVEGVDGVFHINPGFAPNEIDMGIAMVDAARAAGVSRFVFSSIIHPPILGLRNHAAKLPVEEALYESGMNFTVLQPTLFMQTLEKVWDDVAQNRCYAMPYSVHARTSWVDYRDVAEAAALAFTTHRLDYGTFELCAPGMPDRHEVAALMTEALGFPIKAVELPFEDWADASGLKPGPLRNGLKHMYEDFDRQGLPGGNSLVLRAILEREPRTLADYLRDRVAVSDLLAA